MTEWFQEAGCNKNWNFVQFETEKPSGLTNVQACREHLPAEKCVLLFDGIHIVVFLSAREPHQVYVIHKTSPGWISFRDA